MLNAFYVSAVGLQAQKEQLDVVANNFANVNTTAYKRQSVDFSAILDRSAVSAGAFPVTTVEARPLRATHIDLAQGEVRSTGRTLDLAISGPGFLEVELPGGGIGYARGGSLQLNGDGGLSLSSGQALKSDVRIPMGASDVRIQADGTVSALLHGDATPSVVGHIELVTFSNPESLKYAGGGVFTAPLAGGEPVRSRPGEEGAGSLVVGALEASNVQLVDEMVSLTLMQRVYELNSRVVQVADELMGMTNNLRRN